MKYIKFFIACFFLAAATLSFADRDSFCAGFAEGYKSVKGNNVIVPICPVEPVTPVGSTPFQVGIREGIKAAGR